MAPLKRPAVASAGGRGKAAKADPAAKELRAIRGAIEEAEGFPPQVLEMISAGLEHSLLVFRDQRHTAQAEVVKMIGEVLTAASQARRQGVDSLSGRSAASETERAARAARIEGAVAVAAEKAAAVGAAKGALSEASGAFAAAKAALAEAKAAQKSGDASLVAATARRARLESELGVAGDYATLKGGTAENPAKALKALAKFGKDFAIEAQLLESLQLALKKTERGSFDEMVLGQFEAEVASRIAACDAELSNGEAGRVERAGRVEAAEKELTAATETAAACKEALDAGCAAQKEADAEVKAAEKAQKELGPELKQLEAELADAKSTLEGLEAVLLSYEKLRDRETPPPEAPPAEDEPPAAAAADAGDA